jgi:carboxymethylenebutenolidase
MIFSFTHDLEMDWMLPGVTPTGRRVEVPLVVVVQLKGDDIVSERIYWDQASVLAQIGAIDAVGLPVAGAETARKLLDPTLPSNALIRRAAAARD